ncbi:hypothetical protein [Blastococcus sp. TF02A-26]|uniref:hypothetical protein n=1 Tax=Blastococcus sp. TF02A-26 TaxID=2250577 RepID=UPI000DEBF179|nr:hypothetical protein [Blastococcus sp. TF02A-26]RBY86785.1 hypothetical protein DQ240_08215 [Blastococcus sp. TF02A-26]
MIIVRRAGAAILAVAALAVWFLMAPDEVRSPEPQTQEQVRDRGNEIDAALADYELNDARTAGAPQQAVVNGWVAKDLLTIIAEQQNEALTRPEVAATVTPIVPRDDRIPAFAALAVVGLALVAGTSGFTTASGYSAPAGAAGDPHTARTAPQTMEQS